MRRWLVSGVLLASLLGIALDADAGSPTSELREFFKGASRVLDGASREAPEARLDAIRSMVKDIVDVREAARLSLGPTWSARTPAEREEFASLFGDLLQRSLIMGLATRISLPNGVQVRYLGESVDGAVAVVWTSVMSKTGSDLPFTYRMIERAGRWAIRDVVIDGVSMAANYRAQFTRILQSGSYHELVRQLRARVPDATVPAVASAMADDLAGAHPPKESRVQDAREQEGIAERSSRNVLAAELSTSPIDRRGEPVAVEAPPAPRPHLETDVTLTARALPEVTAAPERLESRPTRAAQAPPSSRARIQRASLPPVVATPQPPTPASNATAYWVQVGAFKSLDAARRLASVLRVEEPSDPSAVIVDSSAIGKTLARVRVGPFASRWDAAAKVRAMQGRGHKPFIAVERD